LADAKRHRFDVVVVWALDRLGRSMGDVVANVLELERIGVDLLSAREPWLDTTGPVRSLLVSVFAWVAEWERRRLVERTNAGIARARAEGKQLGRPSVSLAPHLLELELSKGGSAADVARRLGVGRTTLFRELERLGRLGRLPRGRRFAGGVRKGGAENGAAKPPKSAAPRSRS